MKTSGTMIVESGTISWTRVSANSTAVTARNVSDVPIQSFATALWSALVAASIQSARLMRRRLLSWIGPS